jgi:glycosyltransferase involved in cell wall biosynthesis
MLITETLAIADALDYEQTMHYPDDKPEVSVIVPCYNHSDFIEECLTSIFTQETNFLFEVLIGDDASTDDSLEKIESVASRYNIPTRIFRWKADSKWIRKGKPTGKLNFTRLYALTQGKYLATCDGDDAWVSSKKLQLQYEFLERSDYRMVYGQSLFGETIERSVLNDTKRGEFSLETTQWHNYVGHASNTAFWIDANKEKTLNLITKEFLLCPWLDWLLQHIILHNGGRAYILPETLGFYRQHSTGIYSSLSEKYVLLDTYTQIMFQEFFFQNSDDYEKNLNHTIEIPFQTSVFTALRSNPKKYIIPLGRRFRLKMILLLLLNFWKR